MTGVVHVVFVSLVVLHPSDVPHIMFNACDALSHAWVTICHMCDKLTITRVTNF